MHVLHSLYFGSQMLTLWLQFIVEEPDTCSLIAIVSIVRLDLQKLGFVPVVFACGRSLSATKSLFVSCMKPKVIAESLI